MYPPFCLLFLLRFLFPLCVSPWIPSSGPNSSSSCWSRGTDLSRTIQDCSCVKLTPPATRTTRSAHSMMRAWTPLPEPYRPKMVLERISPPSWSGLWRETWKDPLQTQNPAHHLPAVRSISPSPPMMESHSLLRSTSQHKAERLSRRSSRKLSPTHQIRCESRRQCPPRGSQPWTVWARSGALPPAPWLRVSWLYIWDCWTWRGIWLTGRLNWRSNCPLPSLRRPRWSRPALLRLWFPCSALRGLPILQCLLLESALHCQLLENPSPSARPQPPICTVWAPRVCHPPASPGLEYPSPPPPASEARTPLQPIDPAAPPRLLAPSPPPSPIYPSAPPGSLVPPVPPWSGVDPTSPRDSSPLAAPRRCIVLAPLCSFLPPAPPGSSVAPAPLRISGLQPWSPEPSAPPWPPGSSASPWLVGSLSPPRAPPPPVPPPLVGSLKSAAIPPPWLLPLFGSTMGHHHGCALGPAVRLLLRVPPVASLAPPV